MHDACVGEVAHYAVGVDADGRRIADVPHIVTHRVMIVLPRVEGRAEKCLDGLAAREWLLAHTFDEMRDALRFIEHEIGVLELRSVLLAQESL